MPDSITSPPAVPLCPRCGAAGAARNGRNAAGTPTFRCGACGRRYVAAPRKGPVTEDRKALIRRLLAERLALRAIARAVGVSRTWLQAFANALYRDDTPHDPGPLQKSPAGS